MKNSSSNNRETVYRIANSRPIFNTIAGIFALILAAVVIYMGTQDPDSGGGGYFLGTVFLLFGLVGLTFRKVFVFDADRHRMQARTSIIGISLKETYPMDTFRGLEFHLCNERGDKAAHQHGSESMNYKLFINFEENGQKYRLELYSDNNARVARARADEVARFLDVDLKIVDNRKGIERIVHEDLAEPDRLAWQ